MTCIALKKGPYILNTKKTFQGFVNTMWSNPQSKHSNRTDSLEFFIQTKTTTSLEAPSHQFKPLELNLKSLFLKLETTYQEAIG